VAFAKQLLADPEQQIEVPGLGDRGPRMLSIQALAGVIEPRVEEIFSLVQQVVRESGYEEVLSSGIVLTGGSAVMPGMVELGEDIFLKPVRRAFPSTRQRWPTWCPSRGRPRSWASWKKPAWPACAGSRWPSRTDP
jgi:cell division protein FtsA